jgi:hypothetical protein
MTRHPRSGRLSLPSGRLKRQSPFRPNMERAGHSARSLSVLKDLLEERTEK